MVVIRKDIGIIDFKRDKQGIPATVERIEYDPNRNARLALLHYTDGEKRYILHPKKLEVGNTIVSGMSVPIEIGNAMPLTNMPLGTAVHNVELIPGRGGQIVRSAGTSATIMGTDGDYITLRLPSSEVRLVYKD